MRSLPKRHVVSENVYYIVIKIDRLKYDIRNGYYYGLTDDSIAIMRFTRSVFVYRKISSFTILSLLITRILFILMVILQDVLFILNFVIINFLLKSTYRVVKMYGSVFQIYITCINKFQFFHHFFFFKNILVIIFFFKFGHFLIMI